ncbi:Major facilitator, sugar transporter-like, partial [Dillenia turbinata]
MTTKTSSNSPDLWSPLLSATKKELPEKICIDDMLQRYCGEFGIWQLRHFVLTSCAWALESFHTMVMIFADREPGWRCRLGSSCGSSTGFVGVDWQFGKLDGGPVAFGAGVFGHLSDSFLGRKGSLMVVCLLNALFGCLTAFAPNYWTYLQLRLLTGFSTGGVGLCAFVLATEPVGPTKRGAAGMSTFYFFSGGIGILSGLAYIFQTWRELYIVSSIPSILFLVAVIPFISESPRWYLVRGKVNEAMRIMHSIAKSNGKHLPDGVILGLDEEKNEDSETQQEKATKEVVVSGSLMDVIRSPITRIRLILAVAINFLCSVVYYGLTLNVVNLETNIYLSVVLNAVAEMPAYMITAALIDRFGRKPLAIGTLWFSGFFCFLGCLVRNEGYWKVGRMACGILGIFGMAGTYNLLFIYTAELFPTVVRNAALGSTTQASQMGAILSPLVVVMGGWLPFAVFAFCGILAGFLAFYLPETSNKP